MNFTNEQQESLMRIVMTRVGEAITNGNNPFAAILVDAGGNILYSAYNIAAPQTDILGHAELQLIREAAKQHGIVELDTYALFTNAASCAMCASAVIRAGIHDIYYGAPFERHTNPAASYEQLAPFCLKPIKIHSGILAEECIEQIRLGRKKVKRTNI